MEMKLLPVTRRHYEILIEEFPEAFAEKRFIQLLHYLLFPRGVDKESGFPIIPRYLLAMMEKREHHLIGHRYVASHFLEDFKEAVNGKVKIYGYDYQRKKSRTAFIELSEELSLAIEEEMCRTRGEKLVDLITGDDIDKKVLDAGWAERSKLRRTFPQEVSSPAADYAKSLNTVPSQVFSDIEKNLPLAFARARTIKNRAKRLVNLGTLFRMATLGIVPIYKTTRYTPRIYTDGSSAAGLSSEVRKVLFGGGKATFHGDLAAAQLAILAHVWGLEITGDLLASERKVWPSILNSAGLADTEENRGHIKKFVYSTAFGKEESHLKGFATEKLGRQGSLRLLDTPIIQELLAGRRQRQQQMREEGGFIDPFGVKRTLADVGERKHKGKLPTEEKVLSRLLAYEAQAYELALMEPVLRLAQDTKEFRIWFWLHDGVYFRITQPERTDYYLKKLMEAVGEKAKELGIQTRLEIERI